MERIEKHPILSFDRGEKVSFTFDGREMEGYTNETIAAALIAAGVDVFRHSLREKRPRGFFCAIGRCSSCLMTVDDVPNVRVCTTYLRQGMVVQTQTDRGTLHADHHSEGPSGTSE